MNSTIGHSNQEFCKLCEETFDGYYSRNMCHISFLLDHWLHGRQFYYFLQVDILIVCVIFEMLLLTLICKCVICFMDSSCNNLYFNACSPMMHAWVLPLHAWVLYNKQQDMMVHYLHDKKRLATITFVMRRKVKQIMLTRMK